jgi:hypothetical protein
LKQIEQVVGLKLETESPQLKCPVCARSFFTLKSFQEHGFAIHAVCFKCGKWFPDASAFKKHFRQGHIDTWRDGIWAGVSLQCGQCKQQIASIKEMDETSFDYKRDLEIADRMRIHLQQNHFLCPICTGKAESRWIKTKKGWHNHITVKHKQ